MSLWKQKATGFGPQRLDAAELRRALAVLADPGHGVELRGLPSGRSFVRAGSDLDGLVEAAELLSDDAGVYYALNPVSPGLGRACKVADVLRRRWLLIDVDRRKTEADKDLSATDAEKAAAEALAGAIRAWLAGRGWPAPVVVDSGNGRHLLYRLDLPVSDDSSALVRDLTRALDARFSNAQADVDKRVHGPSRIAKLPGTWARKGPASPERPHRPCRILELPEPVEVAPEALLRDATAALAQGPAPAPADQPGADQPAAPSPFKLKAAAGWEAAYARAALEREAGRVATAAAGSRNSTLNEAAFSLGQLMGGGLLRREDVEEALRRAALACGLDKDAGGPAGVAATVKSGLDAGVQQPRGRPERPELRLLEGEPAQRPAEPAPEPFPVDVLPPELQRYALEGAATLQCPVDYLGVAMLCAAATMVGGSRALRLTEDYSVCPALYVALVGDPSDGKSPAMRRVLRPVKGRHARELQDYKARRKLWRAAPAEERGEPPTFTRAFTTDATVEKLAGVLAECPRGLLLFRDELSGLMRAMNQYRAAGKGADRQFYMSCWSQEPISVERLKHEDGIPVSVPAPLLCVLGGLTPDSLPELVERGGTRDGFVERFLFSYPAPPGRRRWVWEAISAESRKAWQDVCDRLWDLDMPADPLRPEDGPRARPCDLTPNARRAWEEWYADHQDNRLREEGESRRLAGHYGKLESYCARFALLVRLLWHGRGAEGYGRDDAPAVDEGDVFRAAALIDYFRSHARRAYGLLDQTEEDRKAEAAVDWVRKRGGSCTARDLCRYKVAGVKKGSEAAELIADLTDRGYGAVQTRETGANRRKVSCFVLHPSVEVSSEVSSGVLDGSSACGTGT